MKELEGYSDIGDDRWVYVWMKPLRNKYETHRKIPQAEETDVDDLKYWPLANLPGVKPQLE